MKLGLIAMSGVRVRDAELEALGLTLPGFVERGEVIAALPSLGLLTIAGYVPDDVELEYVEVDAYSPGGDLPGEFDAVAISSFTARIRSAYDLADRYRAAGTTVLLGGLHVTARPAEAARHADAVVIGRAEPVMAQVVSDLQGGRLEPVYDARGLTYDLNATPLPRFELLEGRAVDRYTVQTQIGCPWDCEFCAASIRLEPGYRTKSVERLGAEIEAVRGLAERPFLELADDNTFASRAHARRVCDALEPFGLRWFTETDVSFGEDEERIRRAADAGCVQVLIGLESPTASALGGVERRRDWKASRADRYAQAIDRIQSNGISVNGCFVLGLDGAGPEQFDAVAEFVEGSGLHEVQVTVQTAFPGSPLHDRLEAEGRLLEAEAWERCTLFDVNLRPDGVTVDELRGGLRQLVEELYAEEAVAARRARFRRARRGAKAISAASGARPSSPSRR